MDGPTEQEIRTLAYQMWEEAGRPEGLDQSFWYEAEQSLLKRQRKEESREEAGASSLMTVGALIVH